MTGDSVSFCAVFDVLLDGAAVGAQVSCGAWREAEGGNDLAFTGRLGWAA